MVLIGKGHAKTDVDQISTMGGKPPRWGTFSVFTDKTKKLFRLTDKTLVVWIHPHPNSDRAGGRELEDAIREAATNTTARGWNFQCEWVD